VFIPGHALVVQVPLSSEFLTIAKSCDPSPNDKLRQPVGRRLQCSADNHDNGASEDCLFASKHVSKPDGCYGAEETSQCVCANHDGLDCRGMLLGGVRGLVHCVDLGEVSQEGAERKESTHNTLV
jgi:hypothetical protein